MEAATLAARRVNLNECIPAIKDSRRIGPSGAAQTQGKTCHVVSYRRCDRHHSKELHEGQEVTRIHFPSDPPARFKSSESSENCTSCSSRYSSCLQNCYWLNGSESITWTMAVNEGHTVTFLTSGQIRPPFTVECPGFSAPSASFDGSASVTSGLLFQRDKFTVVFPVAGNFKLVCLVHEGMTGTIHVFDPSQSLPHDQAFYDREAQRESADFLGVE